MGIMSQKIDHNPHDNGYYYGDNVQNDYGYNPHYGLDIFNLITAK